MLSLCPRPWTLDRVPCAPDPRPYTLPRRAEVLRPIVRYKDLVGALSGLADAQSLSAAPPNKAMAGLRDAVEQDEERVAQLESLFALLDRDSDGRLSAAELEASAGNPSP